MTKDIVQAFSLRVTQANQSELTVITYEIFLEYLKDAKNSLDINDMDSYIAYNKKAQSFLAELIAALNFNNEYSFTLIKVYEYVGRVLVDNRYHPAMESLNEIEKIMTELLLTFREVAKMDNSPGVMVNTQQVYAGLTYGKGCLNETCISDNDINRGFQA